MSDTDKNQIAISVQKKAAENRRMVQHRFFFAYVYDRFTNAAFYTAWMNFLAYLRRFRTIAFLLRTLTTILTVVEAGALVILATAIFLVLLPIAIALTLGILLTVLLESRRSNQQIRNAVSNTSVYVSFWNPSDSGFQSKNAYDLTKRGITVILISPYWLSPKGLRHGRFYSTYREEAPHLYLIRRYYFFSLKKHVLKQANAAYVY